MGEFICRYIWCGNSHSQDMFPSIENHPLLLVEVEMESWSSYQAVTMGLWMWSCCGFAGVRNFACLFSFHTEHCERLHFVGMLRNPSSPEFKPHQTGRSRGFRREALSECI